MGQSHAFCRTELYAKIGRPDRIRTCDTRVSDLANIAVRVTDMTRYASLCSNHLSYRPILKNQAQ